MVIAVSHDFWGNCWIVKADGVIVADGPEEYIANKYARSLRGVMLDAGVKDVSIEFPVSR